MSCETCWTCDRCRYSERSQVDKPAVCRVFYTVEVVVRNSFAPHFSPMSPAGMALWCSECCKELKVLPPPPEAVNPTAPTLEDIICEMVGEEVQRAMEP